MQRKTAGLLELPFTEENVKVFKLNLCQVIPAKKPKKTIPTKQVNVLIVEVNNQILLKKRREGFCVGGTMVSTRDSRILIY